MSVRVLFQGGPELFQKQDAIESAGGEDIDGDEAGTFGGGGDDRAPVMSEIGGIFYPVAEARDCFEEQLRAFVVMDQASCGAQRGGGGEGVHTGGIDDEDAIETGTGFAL